MSSSRDSNYPSIIKKTDLSWIFLLLMICLKVQFSQNNSISLTPTQRTINAITTYNFTIIDSNLTRTSEPTAYLEIIFNIQFFKFTVGQGHTCYSTDFPSTLYNCRASATNIIRIANPLLIGLSSVFRITISNIKNPPYTVRVTFTYNFMFTNATVIKTLTSSLYSGYLPGSLQNCTLSFSPATVFTESTLTVTIRLGNELPKNGSIFLNFNSAWIDQASSSYSAFKSTNNRNCTKLSTDIFLNSPLICRALEPLIILTNSINETAPSGTTLSFSISTIFTPPTTSTSNSIIIRTQSETSQQIVDQTTCTVPAMTSRPILNVTVSSSYMVGANSSLTLSFTSPSSIAASDRLIISSSTPNDTFFNLYALNTGYVMSNVYTALLERGSSSTVTNAQMIFSSSNGVLLENTNFQIKEGFFVMPLITSGRRSLSLSLRRNNSLYAVSLFQIETRPNLLQNLNITLDTYTVSTRATYTFSFNLMNSLTVKSKIILILPSQISMVDGVCNTSITLISSNSLNTSAGCSVANNRTITISSFNIIALNAGEKVTIAISNILNSEVAEQTNAFIISTYYGDILMTPTDTSTTVEVKMQAEIIGVASISSSNPKVGNQGVYTLIYTVKKKFLSNSIVQLMLPSEITFGLNAVSAVFGIKYPNGTIVSDQSCAVTNSTVNQAQYLQFNGISSVQLAALTVITIKVTSLLNPLSLRPSSSFGVYQLDNRRNEVQKLQSGLTITNTVTNDFDPIYATDSLFRVNGDDAIFTISFQTTVALGINDYFEVLIQTTNNPDTQIYFSSPVASTDILYSDRGNTLKVLNSFQRRSSTFLKIDLQQGLQAGKTYQLALNTIIRSRCAQTPGTITLKSFKYVTSTISFGISASSITPDANNKENVLPKITLRINTLPSQLFSLQQFSLTIDVFNQLYPKDFLVIEVPNLFLFVGTLLNVTAITNITALAAQSFCVETRYFCSNFDSNPNKIKVQESSNTSLAFNNISSVVITIKSNLYRSPSTFNYKGYYFNAKTYSSNNLLIDASTSIGTKVTNLTAAEFYLSCRTNEAIYRCKTCNLNGTCISCYQPIIINLVEYNFDGYNISTTDNRCVSNCTNGYFINAANGNICTQCDSPCLTCETTTLKCLSCIQNIITNKYYAANFSCLNTCPNTYYTDSGNLCKPCSSPCVTCIGNAFACTSCTGTTFLNPTRQTCVNSTGCQLGTYPDTTTNKCQPCDLSCNGCLTTSKDCIFCSLGYIQDFANNTFKNCTNQCPAGTVNDTINNLGCRCQIQCKTCIIKTSTCTSCNQLTDFKYLYSNSCVNICPQGSYLALIRGIDTCVQCSFDNCKTCSLTNCTQCSGTYLLYEGVCITQCYASSVLTISNGIRMCLRCLIGCTNCDKDINECSICQSGYLKEGNNTHTYCISTCSAGYVNFNNTQCYTSCPPGYENILGVCSWPNGTNPFLPVTSELSTTKTVPFPFVIAAVILISSVLLSKVVLPYSIVSTMITCIVGILQMLSLIVVVIICMSETSSGKHWTACQTGVYLLAVTLVLNMFLNVLGMFFFMKYIYKDPKFSRMLAYNCKKTFLGKCPIYTIFTLTIIVSHKILEIMFSNFMGSRHFSYKVNTVTNLVPLNYILFSSILPSVLAIAGGSIISYELQNYKTDSSSFVAAVDMIVISVIGIVTCIWVSNRNEKDYEVDIFANENGEKNYQTEEIFVEGNGNEDASSHMNEVFMQQSGIRKVNMSFDKQKNYYYKSSRISQYDEDHANNPLTKRKFEKKPIHPHNSNNILRNTFISDQHSSEALVFEVSKKRRDLKDQFSPQVNQKALNSKEDLQIIEFNKSKSNSLITNADNPLKAIHYPNANMKALRPEELAQMPVKEKQLLKERIRKQLENLNETDKQRLLVLTKQRDLKIKKRKEKIQQIYLMSQKELQALPTTEKEKVKKVKDAVDLLKRKQIKIEEYLLYNEIIKEEDGEYDSDEDNQIGRQISVINAKDKNFKEEDDQDLEEVINLSPKKMMFESQESPNKIIRRDVNELSSPQRDRSQNSKQKTIKKQSNNKNIKSNKKSNNKLNDLHVFYKYEQKNGELDLQKSFDSEQEPELPKIKSNLNAKNKNNLSQKNLDLKKSRSNKQDMLMIDMGSARVNRTELGQGLVEDGYGESVPPQFLHSTQKISKNQLFQTNDKQRRNNFLNDEMNEISPSRFHVQNQRIELEESSDLPTRPRIATADEGRNGNVDFKNPTKRLPRNDGFQIYDTDYMIEEQGQSRPQESRLNSTMNRYSSANHLDYEAILRKNQQNQKLKKLQQIYLPRLQSKPRKKKKDISTSRNNLSRDRL